MLCGDDQLIHVLNVSQAAQHRVNIPQRLEDSVVLQGTDSVSGVIQCVDAYVEASGQQLEIEMSELLPVGTASAPAGSLQGMMLITFATALNLPFTYIGTELRWMEPPKRRGFDLGLTV